MKCLVCGESAFKKIYSGTLLRCNKCSFVTANMNLGEEALRSIYKDYFHSDLIFDYISTKRSRQLNFGKRLEMITEGRGKKEISTILEIGCAYGFFGEVVTKAYPEARYKGIDISSEPVEYGKKELDLDLHFGDYLTTDLGSFTDIFMWDTIEHLPAPQHFIAKAARDLHPKGRLYIATPNIDSFIPKLRKEKWRNITPPTHLHYFSPKTLSVLLERHGFVVEKIIHPPVYRNVKHIWHHVVEKHIPSLKFITDIIPPNWTLPVNTFDNMIVRASAR